MEILKEQAPAHSIRGRKPIYPLRSMRPGDCIKIPLKKNLRAIILSTARQQGIAIITSIYPDEGVLKVWRE